MHATTTLRVLALASLCTALFTLWVHRPPLRPKSLRLVGFFVSWLAGELAPHGIFWLVALTAGLLAAGGLGSPLGWASFALVAASAWGLALALRDARGSEAVLSSALYEGLGERWRDALEEHAWSSLDERAPWYQRVAPLLVLEPRSECLRDVVYAERDGLQLRLDIHRPRGREVRKAPVLLFIHGGAWVLGRKDDQGLPLMKRLAAHGWVCVSANYRLSPRFTWPAHLVDVRAALRWVREHIEEFGGDPDFVVLSGGSAGGHLASLAALTDHRSDAAERAGRAPLAGCVSFYGVYDFTDRYGHWRGVGLIGLLQRAVFKRKLSEARELFDEASPLSQVSPEAPPFFVLHGTHDVLVPVEDARRFVASLRDLSRAAVVYAELPGAQHAFEVFHSERSLHASRAVESFLAYLHAKYQTKRPEEETAATA